MIIHSAMLVRTMKNTECLWCMSMGKSAFAFQYPLFPKSRFCHLGVSLYKGLISQYISKIAKACGIDKTHRAASRLHLKLQKGRMSALVMYCGITIAPKFRSLKEQTFIISQFLKVRNLGV